MPYGLASKRSRLREPAVRRGSGRTSMKKTDREDALKVAQLSAMGQIAPVHMPSRATRQWRMLMEYRGRLVDARTAIRNRIRAVLRSQALDLPAGKKGWSGASREALQELASSLEEVGPEELWRGLLDQELRRLDDVQERLEAVTQKLDEIGQADQRVQLVQTIPGVGPRRGKATVFEWRREDKERQAGVSEWS